MCYFLYFIKSILLFLYSFLLKIYKLSCFEFLKDVRYKMVMMEMMVFIKMMIGFIIINNVLGITVVFFLYINIFIF